jgi:antirestriction protein ArdC
MMEILLKPCKVKKVQEADDFFKTWYPDPVKPGAPAYHPTKDIISCYAPERFTKPEEYYHAIFHELSHWTGHKNRLNRMGIQSVAFGSDDYSYEELIAELSGSEILSRFNIPVDVDNTTAYLNSWVKTLKDNPDFLFKASAEVDKITKYLKLS